MKSFLSELKASRTLIFYVSSFSPVIYRIISTWNWDYPIGFTDQNPEMIHGHFRKQIAIYFNYSLRIDYCDYWSGNMDPYVIITCRTQEHKSSVASGWQFTFFFFFRTLFFNLIICGGRAIIEEDFSQLLNSDLVLFWEHPSISIFGFCRKGEWSRMERDFCFWSFRRSSGTVDQDTRQWWPFRWWFCWRGKVSNFYFFLLFCVLDCK